MAGTSEENICKIGIVDRCWDNTNDREKYQQCTVSCHTSICKGQQQINKWKTMIQVQSRHTPCTGMSTTCMGGWCHKLCQWMVSNGDDYSDKGCIPEFDFQYPKELHKLHSHLPLHRRMKINNCEKRLCNLCQEKLCNTHKSSEGGIGSWTNTSKKTTTHWTKE